MFPSDHLKIHGFSRSERFLTTYMQDYGALRERYPQRNSSSTEAERAPSFTGPWQVGSVCECTDYHSPQTLCSVPRPPSSSFLLHVPSFGTLTPSISVATQGVGSVLSVDRAQDAGVARDAQPLLGTEGKGQCCHGCGGRGNVLQQQEAKGTKTEIIYKEGVVVLSSKHGLPDCDDFLKHLLRESGLQHLLDAPSCWSLVVANKDGKHWDKSTHLWGLKTPSHQNPSVQCSRCARGPECFELQIICQSSALPPARAQPASYRAEARSKLPQTEYQSNYGSQLQSVQRNLYIQRDGFSDRRPPCHWSSV